MEVCEGLIVQHYLVLSIWQVLSTGYVVGQSTYCSQMERSQMSRPEKPLCKVLPGNAVDHLLPVTANLDQVFNLPKCLKQMQDDKLSC